VHAGLGQDEPALDDLERAYEDRCEELLNPEASTGLRTDPRLDTLREHPRFKALLKKVGLAPHHFGSSARVDSSHGRLSKSGPRIL